MNTHTSPKEVRQFVGLVNYYRGVWEKRSHMLAPLTNITSSKENFKWTKIELGTVDEIKRIVACGNLLTYPVFYEEFKIHANASYFRLGAVISHKVKPIAFYSRKITGYQRRYIVT